jgi:DNA replication protein DnaC
MSNETNVNEAVPAVSASFVDEMARELGIDMASVRAATPTDPEERARRAEERSRRAIEEARAADRLARWRVDVGETYQETDWSNPALAPHLEQSRQVMGWQVGGKGMLIAGPSGRGKSRAVAQLYRRLAIEEKRDVRYFHASDWFSLLGENVRYGVDDARKFVNRQAEAPIFIMDDLGQQARVSKEKEEHAQAWFFRFLDLRRQRGMPVLITTNLSAVEIAADPGTNRRNIRRDPLLVRLFDLCDVVSYETAAEKLAREAREKAAEVSV